MVLGDVASELRMFNIFCWRWTFAQKGSSRFAEGFSDGSDVVDLLFPQSHYAVAFEGTRRHKEMLARSAPWARFLTSTARLLETHTHDLAEATFLSFQKQLARA